MLREDDRQVLWAAVTTVDEAAAGWPTVPDRLFQSVKDKLGVDGETRFQPTIRLANTSMIKATSIKPSHVLTYVKSAT